MAEKPSTIEVKRLSVVIPVEAHALLKEMARQKQTSLKQLILELILKEASIVSGLQQDRDWIKELDVETLERILQYAREKHMTPAKAITAVVWSLNVKNGGIQGQMSFKV